MSALSATAERVRLPRSAATAASMASWTSADRPIVEDVELSQSSTGSLSSISASVDRRHIEAEGRHFQLNRDLRINLRFEAGLWCYECSELHLAGCADSYDEAFSRLGVEFAFQWDDIAMESDEALHPSGLRLKRLLRSLVQSAD